MADESPVPLPPATSTILPTVQLEVRPGKGRPTTYQIDESGFLIGNVPGCDLRLPGAKLPPVVCLITRHASGAILRRLAPVQKVAVNGKEVGSAVLADGDCVSVASVEIVVSIQPAAGQAAPMAIPTAQAAPAVDPELDARLHQLQARAEELEQARQQLAAERTAWERQTAETQAEIDLQRQQVEKSASDLARRQKEQADLGTRMQACQAAEEEMAQKRADLDRRADEVQGYEERAAAVAHELAQTRKQLHQVYRAKRDRMIKQELAIRKAGQKIKDRKHRLDEQAAVFETLQKTWDLKTAELEAGHEQLQRERQMLDEQHRLIASRQQEIQRDLAERLNEIQMRDDQLIRDREAFELSQKQHQADLVRLDRIQATLETRQKQLQKQALEVDHRYENLQRDGRELEEQARKLDEWHERLTGEEKRLTESKKQHAEQTSQLDQRAAALETQQTMLATLRTRLERMKEELRQQEETLADQRMLHEAGETDLKERLEEARVLREALDNDRQLHAEEQRRFEERRATLDSAVSKLRQAQESLEAQEAALKEKQTQVDVTAAEQNEQAALLLARGAQIEELQQRLTGDRQALKERELAVAKAELGVTALQEQLRRRSEELAERQKKLSEQDDHLQQQTADWQSKNRLAEKEQQLGEERLETVRSELAARTSALDLREQTLQEQERKLRAERQQHEQSVQALTSQSQELANERVKLELDQQAGRDALAALEAMRQKASGLAEQLPRLQVEADAVHQRLLRSREQMRQQLAEVHAFGRQSREDLELARKQLQVEFERLRQQELALHVARDEHRLAVAAFRQQLIEWQAQIGETKHTLRLDESRLDLKAAEVDQKAQEVESTSARLARQAEELQQREQQVEHKRGEMDRHLVDMREWYRRKLRELSGVDIPEGELPGLHAQQNTLPFAPAAGAWTGLMENDSGAGEPNILSLTGELDSGDRQLGDLLRSLELIDADALAALFVEARRQRRSLRQLLLAGNYLTLYQIALIEAGNLDGLVLGPVRIIDRLPPTPREAIYRVYDPRRDDEALLRMLADAEMEDAVHPDEYRQRFTALAAVDHVHLAATLEVLEIAGIPAVLQEWLTGLPSSDWPALAAAPGVWFRLVSQAALALQTAHAAGILHGSLEAQSFVFTDSGVLKLRGLGEPRWLHQPAPAGDVEPSIEQDLHRLGTIAAGWAELAPRKAGKPKPLPQPLQGLLQRLQGAEGHIVFTNAQGLLQALDTAGANVPANTTAWERFVREVREQSRTVAARKTA